MRIKLALAALAISTPAIADWQGTRWGMTREEVRSASPLHFDEAPAPMKGHSSPDLLVTTDVWGIPSRVRLSFSDATDRLVMVAIRPTDSSACSLMATAVKDRFGFSPNHQDGLDGAWASDHWVDPQSNNSVGWIIVQLPRQPSTCGIELDPLPSPKTGL